MKTLPELFANVSSDDGWITAGDDVQFKVIDDVLYFMPTRSLSDWKHNFDIAREVYDKSDVKFVMHKGFAELWLSVKPIIESLEFDVIVGYSEGGALAVPAHENYFHRKGREPITYTFGCPAAILRPTRALKARFSNLYNYMNPGDIVYYSTMLAGYRHVGSKIALPRVKLSRKRTFAEWLLDLTHHTPERYSMAIKKAVAP